MAQAVSSPTWQDPRPEPEKHIGKPGLIKKIFQRASPRKKAGLETTAAQRFEDPATQAWNVVGDGKKQVESQSKPVTTTDEPHSEAAHEEPSPDDFQMLMQSAAQTGENEREEMLRTITRQRSGRQVELNHPDLGMDLSAFQRRDKKSKESHQRTLSGAMKKEGGRDRVGSWFFGRDGGAAKRATVV